jgi:hypothetical protein
VFSGCELDLFRDKDQWRAPVKNVINCKMVVAHLKVRASRFVSRGTESNLEAYRLRQPLTRASSELTFPKWEVVQLGSDS